MKKILGLDLGTASIGWALVNEAENDKEMSSIIKIGARIINYGDNLVKIDKTGKITPSMEPEKDFASGKGLSPNAGRTRSRGARRNLQRYKLRRGELIKILKLHKLVGDDFIFSEQGNASTFNTYKQRALAVTQQINLDEFVRILLMINKKRGYKSSRKAKGEDEGKLIDGMEVAQMLYDTNKTPGQFTYQLLCDGKKTIPDYYRSDLQSEFDKIWEFQKQFYTELNSELIYEQVKTNKLCKLLTITELELKGNASEKKILRFELRNKATSIQLQLNEISECLVEINKEINNASGYLGAIGDRSKELLFDTLTVGQYLYKQIEKDSHASLKNQIFYRKDYLNEFNTLWEQQAKYYPILTDELKHEIRDVIIFFQRKLKSQKGLLSFCEFESKEIEVTIDGNKKNKTRGSRVISRSSPLFQEFKIWQILNNIEATNLITKENYDLNNEARNLLYEELTIKPKLSKKEALSILFDDAKNYDLNFKFIEGNKTNASLYESYNKVLATMGYDEFDITKQTAAEIKKYVYDIFKNHTINTDILEFNTSLDGNEFEKQAQFQLWHLLYSFEGDDSNTGNDKLFEALITKYGFTKEQAIIMSNTILQDDYGSLSSKAIRKILPHLKDGFSYGGRKHKPDEPSACEYAGYAKHSKASLTKEEKEKKAYKNILDTLPKNSLRNPIVEKILNQTINVVNAIIEEYGKPDEIRIELARELKKSADERKEMTDNITKSTADHEKYRKILQAEFGIQRVTKNDLIRYKLYCELKNNGFKTLYSNTYIAPNKLFSKEFDIEHILPKAKLFDDSFSNKTLELRSINIDKADKTAYDYILEKYGADEILKFEQRVENLFYNKRTETNEQNNSEVESKTADIRISKTKRNKLLTPENKIPSGFIDRELRDTQYIAKKAKSLLEEVCKTVMTTTGSVTDRLREDWQLIDIMQELNWKKYDALGLTEELKDKDGRIFKRIKNWTKRNDHRHHAMDAITIAFTKPTHINYLNNLNARQQKGSKIEEIEHKELYRDAKNKLRFKPPVPIEDFRAQAKQQLENTLISFKANNKVVTKNKVKIKGSNQHKIILTPRGQLHNETLYGKIQTYETNYVKVGGSLTLEIINKVAKKNIREALLKRLEQFDNDVKKAFTGKNSIDKNPIYLDEHQSYKVPDKVKTVELIDIYTTRKSITPELKLDKIIDPTVKLVLEKRLAEFNNDAKAAFSNLKDKPIWLNKEKGIAIKHVTLTAVSNATALHDKKDKDGTFILNKDGNRISNDFVSTSNNHHVAIYKDAEGNLQENVVSFFTAVERANQGLSIVDMDYNKDLGWQFLFTMKRNECFIFPNEKTGFNPKDIDLLNPENYHLVSPNLFRVQKLATKNYFFRHHLETKVDIEKELAGITYKPQLGLNGIINILKVRINHLGKIVKIGE
jgi:CRISPR-associated endonuclease Csn1